MESTLGGPVEWDPEPPSQPARLLLGIEPDQLFPHDHITTPLFLPQYHQGSPGAPGHLTTPFDGNVTDLWPCRCANEQSRGTGRLGSGGNDKSAALSGAGVSRLPCQAQGVWYSATSACFLERSVPVRAHGHREDWVLGFLTRQLVGQ